MKEALADVLPRDILDRKKRGFGTPMGAWLKGALAPLLRRACCRARAIEARGLLRRRRRSTRLIDEHDANRIDGTDRLLALLNLEIWCRVYLDRRAPSDVGRSSSKEAIGVKILYVCHRFPFPPKRGGKIRPFNMIRHLARDARGDGVLARALRRRGRARREGIAPYCAQLRDGAGRRSACRRCAWWRGCRRRRRRRCGFFHSPRSRGASARCSPSERFDLIFVHCSSVAQYVETCAACRRSSTSATWTRRSGSSTRATSRFRCRWATGSEGRSSSARRSGSPRRFDLCTATTRAEWETLKATAPATPTDWFPNGVDSEYFAPGDEPYDPDTHLLRRAHGLLPEPGMHVRFLRRTCCRCCRRGGRRLKLLIVGADPSPAVRKLGELPGVTVTGSVPDVRPYRHARSALMVAPLQHRARHAEQDPRGDGDGRAGGDEPRRRRRRRRRRPASTCWSPDSARGARRRDRCASWTTRPSARGLPRPGRARMLSHHAWPSSMRRLDAHHRALHRRRPKPRRGMAASMVNRLMVISPRTPCIPLPRS